MKLMKLVLTIGMLAGIVAAGPATASLISGFGLPSSNAALSGATVADFTSSTTGTYASLTIGGVTFGGNGTFVISDNYAGSYNTNGRNLQNEQNPGSASVLEFTFASAVSAFAFNFGASNEDWSLQAFDAGNNLLEGHILTQTWHSNAGDYFGIAAAGIAYARATQLTHVADAGVDHILLDNFSYVAGQQSVPEPSALALLALALLSLAATRRFARIRK
jgi:hypothetical protein